MYSAKKEEHCQQQNLADFLAASCTGAPLRGQMMAPLARDWEREQAVLRPPWVGYFSTLQEDGSV